MDVDRGLEVPRAALPPASITHSRRRRWSNWAGTARCRPELTFEPQRLEDLVQIVDFARATGRTVRAVGSGHSWSALVPTDGVLVSMRRLNGVAMDLSDPSRPRVVVESGATVREVNDVLERHGYALPLNVVLESVRLGGLIATGSHGSGWGNRTLSDLVSAIEFVTASGRLRRFERGVDTDEALNAARLALGMFGISYRITLDVRPTWTVRALDRRLPVAAVMDSLPDWVPAHDNLDLFWWPFNDRLWVKSWDRVDAEPTAWPRRSRWDRVAAFVGAHAYRASFSLIEVHPGWTPAACRIAFAATPSEQDQVVEVVEAIHYRRSIEVLRLGCVEVAFKTDPQFDRIRWAMQVVLDATRAYAERGRYPMNVTMNVRFIRDSDCWLSPAFGPGHTCYIEILSRTDQREWERFSGEVAQEWLTLPGARPHWAKEYRHIPGVLDHIRRTCSESIARFNRIKEELDIDPDHMFMNAAMREIFL